MWLKCKIRDISLICPDKQIANGRCVYSKWIVARLSLVNDRQQTHKLRGEAVQKDQSSAGSAAWPKSRTESDVVTTW